MLAERPWICAVVDLGAGTGALASAVIDARRDLDVYAVDLRDRPSSLDDDVAWCRDVWDVDADRWMSGEAEVVLATLDRPTLILAVEWLDDLPWGRHAGRRRVGSCARRRRRRTHPPLTTVVD